MIHANSTTACPRTPFHPSSGGCEQVNKKKFSAGKMNKFENVCNFFNNSDRQPKADGYVEHSERRKFHFVRNCKKQIYILH